MWFISIHSPFGSGFILNLVLTKRSGSLAAEHFTMFISYLQTVCGSVLLELYFT